jgi:hypothetical protein
MFLPRRIWALSVGLSLLAFVLTVLTVLAAPGTPPVIRASIRKGPSGPVVLGLFGRYPRVISPGLCGSLSRRTSSDFLARDSLLGAAGQTATPASSGCNTPVCRSGTTPDDPGGCSVASSYPIADCKRGCVDWGCKDATAGCCSICSWTPAYPCFGCKTTGGCK